MTTALRRSRLLVAALAIASALALMFVAAPAPTASAATGSVTFTGCFYGQWAGTNVASSCIDRNGSGTKAELVSNGVRITKNSRVYTYDNSGSLPDGMSNTSKFTLFCVENSSGASIKVQLGSSWTQTLSARGQSAGYGPVSSTATSGSVVNCRVVRLELEYEYKYWIVATTGTITGPTQAWQARIW